MLERFRNLALTFSDDRIRDTVCVNGANLATIAFVHLVEVKVFAELGLILLSAAYTIWRWRREAKNQNTKGDKEP